MPQFGTLQQCLDQHSSGVAYNIYIYTQYTYTHIYTHVHTYVIGEEPSHPGSWQFPKLQGIKWIDGPTFYVIFNQTK